MKGRIDKPLSGRLKERMTRILEKEPRIAKTELGRRLGVHPSTIGAWFKLKGIK